MKTGRTDNTNTVTFQNPKLVGIAKYSSQILAHNKQRVEEIDKIVREVEEQFDKGEMIAFVNMITRGDLIDSVKDRFKDLKYTVKMWSNPMGKVMGVLLV